MEKALIQRIKELESENMRTKGKNIKLSGEKTKMGKELYELSKTNENLIAEIESMSERILDLEACK